jgi:hypothetical protein
MTAEYPTALMPLRTFENRPGVVYDEDDTHRIYLEDLARWQENIIALETILGLNPQGSFDTVLLRLLDIESQLGGGSVPAWVSDLQASVNLSGFTNDSNFIDASYVSALNVSYFNNDAGYITGSPWQSEGYMYASSMPSNVSYFNNDAGYITGSPWQYENYLHYGDIPTSLSSFENNVGYITVYDIPTGLSWYNNDAGFISSVGFHDLSDYPSDAPGVLTNDGFGNLSWETPSVSGVAVVANGSVSTGSGYTLCTYSPSTVGFYEVGGSILVVAIGGAYSVALVVDFYDAVGNPHTMSIPLTDISGTIHSSPVTTGDGYPLSAISSGLYAVNAGDISVRVVTTGSIYNYQAAGWIKKIA